jgi:hypothetical protein
MSAKIINFPGRKGGEARTTKRVSPIDLRLKQLSAGADQPYTRHWLAKQVGVSYACICQWCNGALPDSFNNIYLRRAMRVLAIDENYLLGLPRKERHWGIGNSAR